VLLPAALETTPAGVLGFDDFGPFTDPGGR